MKIFYMKSRDRTVELSDILANKDSTLIARAQRTAEGVVAHTCNPTWGARHTHRYLEHPSHPAGLSTSRPRDPTPNGNKEKYSVVVFIYSPRTGESRRKAHS